MTRFFILSTLVVFNFSSPIWASEVTIVADQIEFHTNKDNTEESLLAADEGRELSPADSSAKKLSTEFDGGKSVLRSENVKNELQKEKGTDRISKDHWELGGGVSLGYSSFSGLEYSFSPRLQYFVMDKLAVGGRLALSGGNSYSHYGIGPSASYYFWKNDDWASYASQSLFYSKFKNGSDSFESIYGTTGVGINYFVTPLFALGGRLDYRYHLKNRDELLSPDRLNGYINFNLYF